MSSLKMTLAARRLRRCGIKACRCWIAPKISFRLNRVLSRNEAPESQHRAKALSRIGPVSGREFATHCNSWQREFVTHCGSRQIDRTLAHQCAAVADTRDEQVHISLTLKLE